MKSTYNIHGRKWNSRILNIDQRQAARNSQYFFLLSIGFLFFFSFCLGFAYILSDFNSRYVSDSLICQVYFQSQLFHMNSEIQKVESSSSTESEQEEWKVPFVISGCSGVGKGTLIKSLLERYPHLFQLSVSYTTREKRAGQENGIHYHFVDVTTFEKEIANGVFLEHGKIYQNYYGTHRNQIKRISSKGKICILEIDLTAAEKIHRYNPQYNFLFIDPPTFEDLRIRMKGRNTQSQQRIQLRMAHSKLELERIKSMKFYDRITNERVQKTLELLFEYINKKYQLELKL